MICYLKAMLLPLLKWPGGKTRELPLLDHLLNRDWQRYVEPFVGGGACFFSLAPKSAIVNDVNENLIGLYQAVKRNDTELKKLLTELASLWDVSLTELAQETNACFVERYIKERSKVGEKSVRNSIWQEQAPVFLHFVETKCPLWLSANLMKRFQNSYLDKMRRVRQLEVKHTLRFGEKKLAEHFETAMRAGFYTSLRDDVSGSSKREIARFFFIREYCYGSMFRFNRAGKFNIPYGGINYNRKSFTRKVGMLFARERQRLLQRTEVTNEDFTTFFSKRSASWGPDTLVFLDPPYDSDFSDYDKYPFNKECQHKLASIVGQLKASYVLVIKDTPLIRSLYEEEIAKQSARNFARPMVIENYAKRYTYNVRGRNCRDVTHLLIHNMAEVVESS